ncbi:MAG TPA: hypothetical protein VJ739_15705 [Gemmataceae bacterium]|nr:hypothetical protein [Gemmataceae bacterium]
MRAIGWTLCGIAAAAILYAVVIALQLLQLNRKFRRLRRFSDPENRLGLQNRPFSMVFSHPGFLKFLGIGVLFGVAGGLLLHFY